MINNNKITINKDNNNNLNKLNVIIPKIKKYPEPDNIDDNLINSKFETITNYEQHKLDIDESNKFEDSNIHNNLKNENQNKSIIKNKNNDYNKF